MPKRGRQRRKAGLAAHVSVPADETAAIMSLRVKIEMQPGETVLFPPKCVNCGQEAEGAMTLRKRRGRTTREVKAPLCADCQRELQRLSGEEERWLRMGWFFGAVAFILALAAFLLLLPSWLTFGLRLLAATLLAGGAGALVIAYFRSRSNEKARPEKQAVRRAARLHTFSWRATTFEFEDEGYGEQFIDLNREKLLEIEKV